jgi:hypothetical protein
MYSTSASHFTPGHVQTLPQMMIGLVAMGCTTLGSNFLISGGNNGSMHLGNGLKLNLE